MAIETFSYDNKIVRNFALATIIWGIVSNHLPKLKSEVEALLNEV